ncbi:DUF3429 domain-containing protein [Eionea flava]
MSAQPPKAHALLSPHQDTITNYMYLGLLPFFIGAFGPWIFASQETGLTHLFLHYSTIIFSFLAGSLWAIALFAHTENSAAFIARHIHAAIAFSLLPLAAYFLPLIYHIGLLMIGFLTLLFWEKLFLKTLYPAWYQALRHRVSFIVVACHMLALWNILHV